MRSAIVRSPRAGRQNQVFVEALEGRALLSTTYYLSPSGSDASAGTSPSSPWRSIARVNSVTLGPGDSVLFQAGQTFGATGANLIANPGFEAGASSWTQTATPPPVDSVGVHSGVADLQLNPWARVAGQNITANLRPNTQYSFGVWAKVGAPGEQGRVGVTLRNGWATVGGLAFNVTSTNWTYYGGTFQTPAQLSYADTWAYYATGVSSMNVDDYSLVEPATPLLLSPGEGGTPANPVTIGSYGNGRATILAGTGPALVAHDVAGVNIANLNFAGSGRTTNTADGIFFYNDQPGNTKLPHLAFDQIDVSGFGRSGIDIGGNNGASGFSDVRFTGVTSHDNGQAGLMTYGQALYAHQNVYVGHCTFYNNTGYPALTGNSGNGVVLGSVNGGTIERSVACGNGALGDGGVAIWAYNSNAITIQHNEAYYNHTAGLHDGGGFDLDGGVTNSIVQYNYSHDNDGAGYGLYEYYNAPLWGNNTVRYNISQNDGRKNGYSGIYALNCGGGLGNAEIYNNTIYTSPAAGSAPAAIRVGSPTTNLHFRNNALLSAGGAALLDVATGQTGLLFQGNDYWSYGSPFTIRMGPTTYPSLAAWRAATGQETVGRTPAGLWADPLLSNPGAAPAVGNADWLSMLASYRPQSASPLINAGLSMQTSFAVNAGTQDFDGSYNARTGGYSIGARGA